MMDHEPPGPVDPWLWTVSQVADYFRTEASAAIISDQPNARLPDMRALAQSLEANDVCGSMLFDVDSSFLREDCGIASWGMRLAIHRCVEKLKARSAALKPESLKQAIVKEDGGDAPQSPASLPALQLQSTTVPETRASVYDGVGENIRAGEVTVHDSHGRKRRRLNLTQHALEPSEALDPPAQHFNSVSSQCPTDFFGDSSITADELFYGPVALGDEIGDLEPNGDIFIDAPDCDPDLALTNFQFQDQYKLPGESLYVYSQLRHFFRMRSKETKHVSRHGRDALAIIPYREGLLPAQKAQSATVIQMRNALEAVAIREKVAYLDIEFDYHDAENRLVSVSNDIGDWDFLLDKYQLKPSDEELPSYGLSEDELEMPQSTTHNGDSMAEESQHGDDNVLRDRIDDIIDTTLAEFADNWKEKKLPGLEENKAHTLWKKTRNSRSERQRLVDGAHREIKERLQKRLRTWKAEMKADEWTNERELKRQCEQMQVTVEDIEHEKWKIDVWNRKQEPYHKVHRGYRKGPFGTTSAPRPSSLRFRIDESDRLSIEPAVHPADDGFHPAHGHPVSSPWLSPDIRPDDQDEEHDAADEMSGVEDDFVVHSPNSSHDKHPNAAGEHTPGSEVMASHPAESPPRGKKRSHDDDDADYEDSDPDLADLPTFTGIKAEPPLSGKRLSSSHSKSEPIEISSDSATSPLQQKQKVTPRKKTVYSNNPENDPAQAVESWVLEDLAMNYDRKRILIKLLAEAGHEKRSAIQKEITRLREPGFVSALVTKFKSINLNLDNVSDDVTEFATRIYLAYETCDLKVLEGRPSKDIDLTTTGTKLAVSTFVGMLVILLQKKYLSKAPSKPSKTSPTSHVASSEDVISVSDDSETGSPVTRKSKKAKKPRYVLSTQAEQSQFAAEERMKRTHDLQAKIQTDLSKSEVQINVVSEGSPQAKIFVDKKIASQMKEHQISGVRFMWRELTANANDEDGGGQGCILAHTMGLGKTMQTIAVLVALNEAAQSNDPHIYNQLPSQLRPDKGRQLRMLVMCPAQLVLNWRREIHQWASHALSNVFSIMSDSGNSSYQLQQQRHLQEFRDWHKVGGVLLISYGIFRSRVDWRSDTKGRFSESVGREFDKYLLEAPELVVADEAHQLKNTTAMTTKAAGMIQTESRIGLTGTPMSNDVDEIYSLINFAAPNYLGERAYFTETYSTPIRLGNSVESLPHERRKAKVRLAALRSKIEPKVHRADITVLKGSLKSKVEFVLKMPVTLLQRLVYNKYLAVLLNDKNRAEKASQVQIFSWLALLTLLTNHPWAFKRRLLQTHSKKKARPDATPVPSDSESGTPAPTAGRMKDDYSALEIKDDSDESKEIVDLDNTIRALGFSQETIDHLTADIGEDDLNPELSPKMSMLLKILQLSDQCGDKVLVFSSSIPTLEYVGRLLDGLHRVRWERIDGRVKVEKRTEILERFQRGMTDVLIVSTRAGGVGLNMQAANRVVILDFGFNPSHEEQAVGRSYRLGQQKHVFVYRLILGGTFEDEIYNKQMFKTSLTQRVIDKKNPRRNATGNTREWLYSPRDLVQGDLQQWIGKDEILDRILQEQMNTPEDQLSGPIVRTMTTIETLQEDDGEAPLDEEDRRMVQELLQLERSIARSRKVGAVRSGSQTAMPPPIPSTASRSSNRGSFDRGMSINGADPSQCTTGLPSPVVTLKYGQGTGQRPPSSTMPQQPHGLPTGPRRKPAPYAYSGSGLPHQHTHFSLGLPRSGKPGPPKE